MEWWAWLTVIAALVAAAAVMAWTWRRTPKIGTTRVDVDDTVPGGAREPSSPNRTARMGTGGW